MKSPLMKGIACAMTLAMALAPCPAFAQEASASKTDEAAAEDGTQAVPAGKAGAAQDETSAKSSRDDETSSKTTSSETAAGKDSTQVGKEASSTGKSDPQKSAPDPDEPAGDSAKEDAGGKDAAAEDKKAADGIIILSGGSWQNTEDGKKQYLRQDGTLAKDGLYEIDGKRYLFSKDGIVQTGWQTVEYQGKQQRFHFQDSGIADTGVKIISGTLYCFDEATAVMLTGWQTIDGKTYLLDTSGAALHGWQQIDGKWYRLDDSTCVLQKGWLAEGSSRYWLDEKTGAMAQGWAKVQDFWYWFDAQGHMKTGWLLLNGTWYWLDQQTGKMATGWQKISGTWYYFLSSGAMATGWAKDGSTWYWLDTDTGAMQTEWLLLNGTWYWLDSSGAMATGWRYVNGSWYYFLDSGAMATGWVYDAGSWYWCASSGAMQTGWIKLDGIWYWLSGSGAMQTGWLKQGNDWYYLNGSGAMCTSYFKIGDSWYYAYSNGVVMYEDVAWDSAWKEYVIVGPDWHAHTYHGTVLDIPWYINQYAEGAPEGCEGASLLMALWSKGYCLNMSYKQFLKTMPYATDGNPYHGFVGTPYANDGNFDTIMMPAVAKWGARYAHTLDITGCSVYDMLYQLSLGHPVIVWTSYKFYPSTRLIYWWGSYKTNNHVMLLRGFNPKTNTFYVADPYIDGMEWISWNTFMNSWTVLRGAVAVW